MNRTGLQARAAWRPLMKAGSTRGASVIKCCYAAKGIGAAVIGFGMAESATTNGMVFDEKQLAGDEKMSLNVSRRLVRPACIAGVRVSRPNFRALCGRMKL